MKLHLLLTLVLSSILCFSQTNEIDSLRFQIFKGDIEALKSMGKYLDSKKIVTDHLGYHIRKAEERQIAARNIRESFFSEEMSFLKGDRVSSTIFFNFLSTNQIVFDEDIGYFILKNQNPDTTKYILFKTSSSVIDSINDEFSKSMPSIMSECGADWSYTLHNPQCLLLLSQYFLKQRAKWNIYFFNDETYFKCFRYLTHIDFAVPDEDSSFNFIYHLTSEFKRRNLYNYFYHHYKDYKWNDSLHYFINTTETPRAKNELVELFELLQSEDDSIAFSSFSRICESDPIEVTRLSKEFNEQDHDDNDKLPTFTYRFLPVIAHLTDYYRRNNIHYKSSGEIKKILEKLLNENSFKKRYEIEELLIKTATIDDIYAIEHFGLINENNFNNTYSIGRVLDKWYSKNWKAVYSEKKHLQAYLKKAEKFGDLGIIGTCNKYLYKFQNATVTVLNNVKLILDLTTDPDIIKSASFVTTHYQSPVNEIPDPIKKWDGEKEYSITDPENKLKQIMQSSKRNNDKENEIEKISGLIAYEQIGQVLKVLLLDTTLDNYSKFNFLESDFGFELNNLEEPTIDSFLKKYQQLPQKDLYLSNLSSLGINIENNGTYDFPKIYEILKYDVVDAFVGGGGGRRDNNVYQLIKLLELHFGTTLGFINKLCSWQGTWGCDCSKRAMYWMNYLREKKLVIPDVDKPISVSFNE